MPGAELEKRFQDVLNDFVASLQKACKDNLLSIVLYGSGSSGEFVDSRSNLNVLVVLKDSAWENLKKSSALINRWKFRLIKPLFFTIDEIINANDCFPIEFLDMKENYRVLFGQDLLKDISIDTRNLRFQCEQELREKLIALRHFYLRLGKEKNALLIQLLKTLTSITHILRNVLRIKGKQPPYLKEDILKKIALEFQIDRNTWSRLLAAKNKKLKLKPVEIESLCISFTQDLEKIIAIVDKL